MATADLTPQRLREILNYDPETGDFHWRIKVAKKVVPGQKAGSIHLHSGYQIIGIYGVKYRAHRLAWLYVVGSWPTRDIDHVDGDRANNAFGNLREVTMSENTQNQRRAKTGNQCGYLGVHFHPATRRWRAQIRLNGKQHHIGLYDSPEIAHAAYVEAKRAIHPFGKL